LRTAQDGEQVRPSALGAYRNPKRKAADLRLSFDGLQSMVSDYRRIQSSTGTGDLVFNWTHGGIREGCTRSLPSSDGASRDALQRVADRPAMRLKSTSLWLLATMRPVLRATYRRVG